MKRRKDRKLLESESFQSRTLGYTVIGVFQEVRRGKREYLNHPKTRDLMNQLNGFFEGKVEIPRIKHGNRQTLDTLISEEALLFAKFLRHERETWIPRVAFTT